MEQERKLTIILHPDGRVSVEGPIKDKILCYGMLEMARQAVHEYKIAGKIVAPKIPLVPSIPIGRGNGGQR